MKAMSVTIKFCKIKLLPEGCQSIPTCMSCNNNNNIGLALAGGRKQGVMHRFMHGCHASTINTVVMLQSTKPGSNIEQQSNHESSQASFAPRPRVPVQCILRTHVPRKPVGVETLKTSVCGGHDHERGSGKEGWASESW